MSRRQSLHARTPGPVSSDALSPTEIVRLRAAALAGVRDPLWGSQTGRLHLDGKLTAGQLAAAKRWAALVANYSTACGSPKAPHTVTFERGSLGVAPDPDSLAGRKLARQHEAATMAFLDGRSALRKAGAAIERTVEDVVIRDRAPVGFDGLEMLRAGLQILSDVFSATRRKPRA